MLHLVSAYGTVLVDRSVHLLYVTSGTRVWHRSCGQIRSSSLCYIWYPRMAPFWWTDPFIFFMLHLVSAYGTVLVDRSVHLLYVTSGTRVWHRSCGQIRSSSLCYIWYPRMAPFLWTDPFIFFMLHLVSAYGTVLVDRSVHLLYVTPGTRVWHRSCGQIRSSSLCYIWYPRMAPFLWTDPFIFFMLHLVSAYGTVLVDRSVHLLYVTSGIRVWHRSCGQIRSSSLCYIWYPRMAPFLWTDPFIFFMLHLVPAYGTVLVDRSVHLLFVTSAIRVWHRSCGQIRSSSLCYTWYPRMAPFLWTDPFIFFMLHLVPAYGTVLVDRSVHLLYVTSGTRV